MTSSQQPNPYERYLAPKDQPVFRLDCKNAFLNLTPTEKQYAHFLSQASWHGSLVCLYQTSVESPLIFSLFQKLFKENAIETLKEESRKNGVSDEDFHNFLQYAATFYGNLGNYLSFGDTKFVPRLPREKFQAILQSAANTPAKNEILSLFEQARANMYSLDPRVLSLGLEDKGISTYYSDNIKVQDIELVRGFMQEKSISPYNTRLWKLSDSHFQIRIASSQPKKPEGYSYKGVTIEIIYGDHAPYLEKVVDNISKAIAFAANDNQKKMLEKYVEHFTGGSIDDHKDAQRYWIKDIGPVVETNIGFIESYQDPQGERGEFEGFVAVVNKETSAKFGKLVENAVKFIAELPWPKGFERDKFLKPDFTSLDVLSFASSGVPAGINIPNYDDIRQNEGFKNVSLGNVIAAKAIEPPEFILPTDAPLYDKLEGQAFEVQVGIHELLGHGTGKLLQQDAEGTFNFPPSLINPLTGAPIATWYKPGETWDSKFQSFASTMEECRAECCGIYLCTNQELLSIFGYEGQNAEDIYYVNWLIMCRAGLRALEFYTPETKKWGQAHMQGRYAIFRVLLAAGQGLVTLQNTGDNVFVVLDRSKIASVGRPAIADFMTKLQIYKSTADVESATKWYSEWTSVPDDMIAIRDIVLARKKPRRVFVQPHTAIENGEVVYHEFDATPEGIIKSFVTRFD